MLIRRELAIVAVIVLSLSLFAGGSAMAADGARGAASASKTESARKTDSAREPENARETESARSAAAPDPRGFLYGTISTEEGKRYVGLLRWGTEEAFWDDLFNGTKSVLPYIDKLPEGKRKRNKVRIFGLTIGYEWDESTSQRQFVTRFGDIKEIRPRRGDEADLTMKDGTTHRLEGGSNDLGAEILVLDPSLGAVTVRWENIDRIVFEATPPTARPEGRRLYGDVTTEDGAFHGFIQWDSQECVSTDKLDGESDGETLSLDMGRIRSIEKRSAKSSSVELKDGREFVLSGTNDVDSSVRGILVEDERFGRVKISWDAFKKVVFRDSPTSGRAYAEYKTAAFLQGTATAADGKVWRGRIVYDLDESQPWEMLDGEKDGVEYDIPFGMVRGIQPKGMDGCLVTLRNGTELALEETQDVSESNAGLVVIPSAGGEGQYLSWDRVRRIDLD